MCKTMLDNLTFGEAAMLLDIAEKMTTDQVTSLRALKDLQSRGKRLGLDINYSQSASAVAHRDRFIVTNARTHENMFIRNTASIYDVLDLLTDYEDGYEVYK